MYHGLAHHSHTYTDKGSSQGALKAEQRWKYDENIKAAGMWPYTQLNGLVCFHMQYATLPLLCCSLWSLLTLKSLLSINKPNQGMTLHLFIHYNGWCCKTSSTH